MMTHFLAQIDAAPPEARWKMARGFLFNDPLPFFAELRENRPVLAMKEVTLVTRAVDCNLILDRPKIFGVDLYKPKQGNYFMAQDDTAAHWREKSIMKSVLDVEDLPEIRNFIRNETDGALRKGNGTIELVRAVTRGVPIKLVQDWFGFTRSDPNKLINWSYWNQQDAFWNQPFDSVVDGLDQGAVVEQRKKASVMMAIYLGRLVLRRSAAVKLGSRRDDPVSRLLRLSFSDGVNFNMRDVIFNVGGLLIGAIETTSHAVCNALSQLKSDPALLSKARDAALGGRLEDFDGYVFEALRFNPAFPYFFRTCHRDTELSGGTTDAQIVPKGTTVLAVTHSAMFDPQAFPDADKFDPQRDLSATYTFGHGIHSCLGRHIAGVMVPEIVRQILQLSNLDLDAGPDFKNSTVPQSWLIRYAA